MKQSFFERLVCSIVIVVCSLQAHAQFASPTYSQSLYPTPISSTDYLDNVNTKYLSNFSCDRPIWTPKCPSVVGWTFDESVGGGGMIMVGAHLITSASSTFVEEVRFDVPNAVDLRVGWMGNDLIVAAYWDASVKQYVFSWWNWAGPGVTTVTYGGTTTLPTTGPTPVAYERISMDITSAGDEAYIVFSDQGSIWGARVDASGVTPTLLAAPVELSSFAGPSGGNIYPDISLNSDGGLNAYVTYHDLFSGNQHVYVVSPGVFVGGSGYFPVGTEALPTGVSWVNFDCPDYYNQGDWAYVYSDGNKIYLRADTGLVDYTTVINDGTISGGVGLTDISAYGNTVPDIAYNLISAYDDIFLVWVSNAPGSFSTGYTNTFIGTTIRVTGGSAPTDRTAGDYTLIDNVPSSYYVSGQPLISIDRSALKADRLVTWITDHSVNGVQMKHKNIAFATNFYRTTGLQQLADESYQNLKLYPNPFSDGLFFEVPHELNGIKWTISMSDLFGRTVRSYSGNEPHTFLHTVGNKLAAGTYFIKFHGEGSEPFQVKVVKQ